MLKFFIIFLTLSSFAAVADAENIDLSGQWRLTLAGNDDFGPVSAMVPGDVHSALLDAGVIEDTYYARNELENLWVGREDWIFSREFNVSAEVLSYNAVYLRAEDVDTFCDITVNGHKVGSTTNRFRRWEWDVRPYLKEGKNIIEGYFHSAEIVSEKISGSIPYEVPLAKNLSRVPTINVIRKPTCHGGWDWGPCQMVTGFAGKVELIPVNVAKIDYVMCDQTMTSKGDCEVVVNAELYSPEGGSTVFKVDLGGIRKSKRVSLPAGRTKVSLPLTVKNPELWWPNGMGGQHLYPLTVTADNSVVKKKIGIRTIEVINQADTVYGKPGFSMTFRVNGKDVYAKGSNWIPCDLYETRQTYGKYADILSSAAEANMNMVRVWGGGQFEHDAFYQVCDSLGIMIWHDFMFSCSTYPGTKEFLDEVEAELNHQIRRLRDHSSIAMWCGDNECVGALGWFECSRENPEFYTANYDKLVRLRDKVVKAVDPQRVYWPSSPCAGFGDYTTDNWKEDTKGDMHLWSVSKEAKTLDNYYDVKPRFCSEYGHSAFSSTDVASTYCSPGQLDPWSPDFTFHQKEFYGNNIIFDRLFLHFRFPNTPEDVFYLSQVEQAMGLKTASEFWRTLEPDCMGSIIWQLNDIWPGTSWSSIEYTGKWKQSHYHIKRFYAPELILAVPSYDDRNVLNIWTINDGSQDREYRAEIILRKFDGEVVSQKSVDALIPACHSANIASFNLKDFGDCLNDRFLELKLYAGDKVVAYNDWLFDEFKNCALENAAIRKEVTEEDGIWTVSLTTDKPAFFVWLNADGIPGEFSDNSFTLYPGSAVKVTFTPKDGGKSFSDFANSLHIKHLNQTY